MNDICFRQGWSCPRTPQNSPSRPSSAPSPLPPNSSCARWPVRTRSKPGRWPRLSPTQPLQQSTRDTPSPPSPKPNSADSKHARTALSRELLARVERAARRRREAEHDLHQAIARATRLGLAQRNIATAAQIAHATVRAILTRANGDTATALAEPDATPPPSHATDSPLPS